MIRVFICSDVRVYREGLAEVLAGRSGVTIVGTSSGGQGYHDRVRSLAADVVLLDMASAESIATLRALSAAAPGARVVALGISETEPEVVSCAEAGVAGYVTRDQPLDDLLRVLSAVARGEAPCSPRAAAMLLHRVGVLAAGQHPPLHSAVRLTAREQQILGLIRDGLTNKQIGHRLCIELPTVKNHVHHILEKLGVPDRHEAAAVVRELTHL
jgi:DNA-binding NarL/FixJ family response regulator